MCSLRKACLQDGILRKSLLKNQIAGVSDMRINMPENANRIIETLEAAGYEAYIVGGCVRDSILGRSPGDWDITT